MQPSALFISHVDSSWFPGLHMLSFIPMRQAPIKRWCPPTEAGTLQAQPVKMQQASARPDITATTAALTAIMAATALVTSQPAFAGADLALGKQIFDNNCGGVHSVMQGHQPPLLCQYVFSSLACCIACSTKS
jgi:hypothetical protein